MTYFVTDPLQDTTGSDHTLIGEPVFSDNTKIWSTTFATITSTGTSILMAAPPRFLRAATTAVSNHTVQARPTDQVATDTTKIVQIGARLPAGNQTMQGVGIFELVSGIGNNSVYAGVGRIAGVESWLVYRIIAGVITLVASGPLPLVFGTDYCARLKCSATGYELFIAVMDETANPNASFNRVYSDGVTLQPATPAMGLMTFSSAINYTLDFYNPTYSDGSKPYQFFLRSYNGTLDNSAQINLRPYGAGWLGTVVFDFTQANNYSLTLPTDVNDSPVKFSLLEFINIGNVSPVKVTIGIRQFIVPPNQTVTFNIDPLLYLQIIFSATDGAMRMNAYADTDIKYQSIR